MNTPTENVVAEWRAAMEGVTPGPWTWGARYVAKPIKEGVAYQHIAQSPSAEVEPDGGQWDRDAAHIARCSPNNIAKLLDHIDALSALTAASTPSPVEAPADGVRERIAIAVRDALIRGVHATESNGAAECDFRGPQDSETGEIPCDLGGNCACVQIGDFAERVVKNMRSLDIPKVLALAALESTPAQPVRLEAGTMNNPRRKIAQKIMRDLLKDITDRRGWRQQWDQFDDDVKVEIRATHTAIIEKHLEAEGM